MINDTDTPIITPPPHDIFTIYAAELDEFKGPYNDRIEQGLSMLNHLVDQFLSTTPHSVTTTHDAYATLLHVSKMLDVIKNIWIDKLRLELSINRQCRDFLEAVKTAEDGQ